MVERSIIRKVAGSSPAFSLFLSGDLGYAQITYCIMRGMKYGSIPLLKQWCCAYTLLFVQLGFAKNTCPFMRGIESRNFYVHVGHALSIFEKEERTNNGKGE